MTWLRTGVARARHKVAPTKKVDNFIVMTQEAVIGIVR
jgi:hypothetical protein